MKYEIDNIGFNPPSNLDHQIHNQVKFIKLMVELKEEYAQRPNDVVVI
jgi:hypothetical protein